MRTVRRLLHAELLGAIAFVTLAFLALFFFIDLVDDLDNLGRGGYGLHHALGYCLLLVPGHFYELFPIAVLIGAIYALARLAQSSEFTILRTGGLGPGRALGLLGKLGLVFALLTFVVGDVVAPWADQQAETVHALWRGRAPHAGRDGAWLKDRAPAEPGEQAEAGRFESVRIKRIGNDGRMEGLRIYAFDAEGQLLSRLQAERGTLREGAWHLEGVRRIDWQPQGEGVGQHLPAEERLAELVWPSTLSPAVVAASITRTSSLSTLNLWRYMRHLSENAQAAQKPAIQFWKKALYPLACLVMLGLALPFAYLQARRGGVSLKVFGGILLGISFVLLNNVSTHLGLLREWTPWLAAGAPSAVYLLLSLAAFTWLVRTR